MKRLFLVLIVVVLAFAVQPAEAQVVVQNSYCPPTVYYPYYYPYYEVRPQFRLLPRARVLPPVILPRYRYVVPRRIIIQPVVPPPCPCW
jgi:hypothetical protein